MGRGRAMKIEEIIKLLEGRLVSDPPHLEREVDCAFACDMISDILLCVKEPALILTGLTNLQVIRLTDMIDVPAILFVRGKNPPKELIEMAKERDLPLISTPMTMFQSCGLLFSHGLRSARIG
jgi:hypothetical protein